ncbi:DUF3109 family protein [Solitalea koreensis]|uniref:DUF3109 family protein n=1 Tax=Solitalea koreensis TaxID=543615 RepID=A0A521CNB4_9SPHI|nr:DUF3109 family protein [Solitalea koreensis]SMO60875.1 Protein of unknown function [Solitalea koreensis]
MIQVENTLVHEDIIKEYFVCNLNACKGACCVQGNAGAPLENNEREILEEIYPKIKPYLTEKGIQAIEKDGTYVVDFEGDYTTTCVDGDQECAYTVFENGTALCGIERAWKDGVIDFRKPISCHLYPIRITKYPEFDILNYDRWNICSAACSHGSELKVSIHQFLKEPLIRKYGQAWYDELEEQIAMR